MFLIKWIRADISSQSSEDLALLLEAIAGELRQGNQSGIAGEYQGQLV